MTLLVARFGGADIDQNQSSQKNVWLISYFALNHHIVLDTKISFHQ